MNILIIGDGDDERAWADWAIDRDDLDVIAVHPGFTTGPPFPARAIADLDEALAAPGVDVAIVGGPVGQRAETLRRAAAEGLAVVCLHPPGLDSEAFYQIALSRRETGAVVVPDLPLRLHPGVDRLRAALADGGLGAFRTLRHEAAVKGGGGLVHVGFSQAVDVVRAVLGEIETLNAAGDPPGPNPEHELIVHLRAERGRRAEIRLPADAARLTLAGSLGSIMLEYDHMFNTSARLIERTSGRADDRETDLGRWDARAAIFDALRAARTLGPDVDARLAPAPNLHDGTRSMELTEAVVRSLRRGRTVDLHYERISEAANFKSVMTSTGCMLLLGCMFALPLALAGPALGFNQSIYIAYLIPPLLVVFAALQLFRFAIKPEPSRDAEEVGDQGRAED